MACCVLLQPILYKILLYVLLRPLKNTECSFFNRLKPQWVNIDLRVEDIVCNFLLLWVVFLKGGGEYTSPPKPWAHWIIESYERSSYLSKGAWGSFLLFLLMTCGIYWVNLCCFSSWWCFRYVFSIGPLLVHLGLCFHLYCGDGWMWWLLTHGWLWN